MVNKDFQIDKFDLIGSGRRQAWSCRHCSVQWRRAVAVSQHMLRPALHIVSIGFELN